MKQQCLHIGNRQSISLRISLLRQWSPVVLPNFLSDGRPRKDYTYPPDTKGFLYYSIPPEKPRIAGELRFRFTSSNDAASFESGSDLFRSDGQPWSRSLYYLSKYYFPLYEKLREDQLIPDDLNTALAALPSEKYRRRSHVLHTLNDTFIVDFSISQKSFFVITEQGAERLRFLKLFLEWREVKPPYTGAYTDHHLSALLLIILINL